MGDFFEESFRNMNGQLVNPSLTWSVVNPSLTWSGTTAPTSYSYATPGGWTQTVWDGIPANLSISEYEDLMTKLGKGEELKVNVVAKEPSEGTHIVYCKDENDLSPEKILTTLSAVKGRLMLDVAPIHIKDIICSMTPIVRQNILQASRRLKMYGKKMPIIARFDEYGNSLPEQIEINDSEGITIKILNPDDVGELYFEMIAVEFPSVKYSPKYDTAPWEEDLPF